MNIKKEKTSHIIILIALFFSSIIFLIFMFWWVAPYKTLEVTQPYKIVNGKELKRGDILIYEIEYCKYTNAQSTVRRQFVDGIIYATPEITANLKKGCGITANSITIPSNLPPGVYYLTIEVYYKVNPIRIITHELKTETFEVI